MATNSEDRIQGYVINNLEQFEETYDIILEEFSEKEYNVITIYGILEDIKRIVTEKMHNDEE